MGVDVIEADFLISPEILNPLKKFLNSLKMHKCVDLQGQLKKILMLRQNPLNARYPRITPE